MLKAKDIMVRNVITARPETEMVQAAKILLENHINGIPVVEGDMTLVGILCQSDLIARQKKLPVPSVFTLLDGFFPLKSTKHLEKELHKMLALTVGEAMTRDPVSVSPEAGVEEIATLMVEKKFHTIPVVEGKRLVGVIGKEDVLKTI